VLRRCLLYDYQVSTFDKRKCAQKVKGIRFKDKKRIWNSRYRNQETGSRSKIQGERIQKSGRIVCLDKENI
jgi:hypothetical protein